ncbi:MAG: polyphosphate kinase 1, partial [Bacteroidia bacterium]
TLFAHVGTGNFNENTAKVYTDYSLLTSDVRITKEVEKVFKFLQNNYERATFKNLWVSPFNTRRKIIDLIDKEIAATKEGKEAWMIVKVNNLVDDGIIRKLYQASTAGVKIQCIIRGTCGLVPGVKGMSDNISVISIIDRFLEHSRVFITANQGNPLFFLGSADWMLRNLDFRVEVTTPIFQESLKEEIWQMIQWQLNDNQKARIIHRNYENDYQMNELPPLRSQEKIYEWFQSFGS